MTETTQEFLARRQAIIDRYTNDTFKALCANLPQHIQDAVQNQLQAIYAHGWLDAYREIRSNAHK